MSERRLRALRGATTVTTDAPAAVHEATRELLAELVARNELATEEVVSAIFTVTADLTSENPARAARALGWHDVPLLCVREMDGSGGPPRCIRVLLHVETTRARAGMAHVYLGGARALRPDLAGGVPDA